MADTEGFDPRYDPAFQRGYSGTPATGARPTRRRADVEPSQHDADYIELFPPQSRETVRPAVEPAPEGADTADQEPMVPETPVVAGSPLAVRGNPFVMALWIIAAALIAGGLGAYWYGQSIFTSITEVEPATYVLSGFLTDIAPWLVACGVLTAVAVVVLHAAAWRRREG